MHHTKMRMVIISLFVDLKLYGLGVHVNGSDIKCLVVSLQIKAYLFMCKITAMVIHT